jgi:hypothetical protein
MLIRERGEIWEVEKVIIKVEAVKGKMMKLWE